MANGNIDLRVTYVETAQLDRLKQQMDRIEFKLDQLIGALAEEQDDTPPFDLTLDGMLCGAPREEGTPL